MIDAHTAVSFETKVAVVPPAEAFFGLLKQPEAVVQTQLNQAVQMLSLFGCAVNGACHTHRVPHIEVVKCDVVVTHEYQLGVG